MDRLVSTCRGIGVNDRKSQTESAKIIRGPPDPRDRKGGNSAVVVTGSLGSHSLTVGTVMPALQELEDQGSNTFIADERAKFEEFVIKALGPGVAPRDCLVHRYHDLSLHPEQVGGSEAKKPRLWTPMGTLLSTRATWEHLWGIPYADMLVLSKCLLSILVDWRSRSKFSGSLYHKFDGLRLGNNTYNSDGYGKAIDGFAVKDVLSSQVIVNVYIYELLGRICDRQPSNLDPASTNMLLLQTLRNKDFVNGAALAGSFCFKMTLAQGLRVHLSFGKTFYAGSQITELECHEQSGYVVLLEDGGFRSPRPAESVRPALLGVDKVSSTQMVSLRDEAGV
ncbi:hypothetical protein AJ80_01202 [Polytolypa hystricis UAMH7299]|uniref:Uncharacterized protein n=1 Tax=Polytolypa hystricis (strain UAMH7299) TaxID=1447883 RepID=A0A2B7Z2F1_POLH7|nr:hypothetical protein AJ80_01202 [Polytolypa hystricis UAMH7299]